MVSFKLLGAVALAALPLALATDRQEDYPGCPLNNERTKFYCCDAGNEKALYTVYGRPSGGDFGKYYEEGWRKKRQINWVAKGKLSMYKPDAPEFVYGDDAKMCSIDAASGWGLQILKRASPVDRECGESESTAFQRDSL